MPGFKGKKKWGLILTLYKKPFRYGLPVSPPRKRTKTSSNTHHSKNDAGVLLVTLVKDKGS
jgi:hypothetical protein